VLEPVYDVVGTLRSRFVKGYPFGDGIHLLAEVLLIRLGQDSFAGGRQRYRVLEVSPMCAFQVISSLVSAISSLERDFESAESVLRAWST
jgi:hypothetical protein